MGYDEFVAISGKIVIHIAGYAKAQDFRPSKHDADDFAKYVRGLLVNVEPYLNTLDSYTKRRDLCE